MLSNLAKYFGLDVGGEKGFYHDEKVKEYIDSSTKGAASLSELFGYHSFCCATGLFESGEGKSSSCGFMFEIDGVVGSHSDIEKNLNLFFNAEMPANCYLQFLLIGGHRIDEKIALWKKDRSNQNQMLQQITKYREEFVRKCAVDFAGSDGRQGRDFRIYVSFSKFTENSEKETQEILKFQEKLEKKLKSIKLNPRLCGAQDLQVVAKAIVDMRIDQDAPPRYSLIEKLSDQIIHPLTWTQVNENEIVHESSALVSKLFKVKKLPESWSLALMINLLGSATSGFSGRLILSYTVATNINEASTAKILAQGQNIIAASSKAYSKNDLNLQNEAAEWKTLIARAKSGERFMSECMMISLTAPKELIETSSEQLMSLYNTYDWQLEVSEKIQLPSLLSQLPMQQAYHFGAMEFFKVAKRVQSFEVVAKLPIHCEWKGVNKSGVLLSGRRGQLFNWNPFVRIGAGNYNVAVIAPSGSGKSVFLQEVATSMLLQNMQVFILDIGASYKNICHLVGGEYISFNAENQMSLNPFASLAGSGASFAKAHELLRSGMSIVEVAKTTNLDEEQLSKIVMSSSIGGVNEEKIEILKIGRYFVTKDSVLYGKSIVSAMIGAKGNNYLEALIEKAINIGIEEFGEGLDITKLAQIFAQMDGEKSHELCDTLYPYTLRGIHGRFFATGETASYRSLITIFELEEIKDDPILLSVILQVILMQVTAQFLCGDRSRQFLLIVDEAWKVLDHSDVFFDAFARTVRKYGGSLVICVQNLDDFRTTPARKSILGNSAWSVFLKQDEKGMKAFAGSSFEDIAPLIQSLSLVPHKYAELLLLTSGLRVVGRLALDPYSSALCSTDRDDFEFLKKQQENGVDKDTALKQLANQKYGGSYI
jgi:hypothetical protein